MPANLDMVFHSSTTISFRIVSSELSQLMLVTERAFAMIFSDMKLGQRKQIHDEQVPGW
jgi:hypothetical protein